MYPSVPRGRIGVQAVADAALPARGSSDRAPPSPRTAGELDRRDAYDRDDRASRTSAPSRSLSSQNGQTRGPLYPSGVNTRMYASVTNDPQFWHSGIP